MQITKIFEVVSKHIEELEQKLKYKEIEIDNLKNKIKRLEGREYEKIEN